MKIITFILLLITSSISYGQEKPKQKQTEVKNDSVKTIPAYETMIKTLSGFEKEIQAIQEKQKLYLQAVLESYGYDFEKARNLHFENGKFIFTLENTKK
jgi:hypothetical protein